MKIPSYITTLEATQMGATVERLVIIATRTELVYITPKYVKTYSRPQACQGRKAAMEGPPLYRLAS